MSFYGHLSRRPFCFTTVVYIFFFSAPNLRGRLADRHQALPHVRWSPRFIKFRQKFGWPPSPEIWRPKNIKISTISRLDREYLRNTRYRQSENGIANYTDTSRTGKLNSVYFGPQTAKNRTGVLTHSAGGHQTGHCPHLVSVCSAYSAGTENRKGDESLNRQCEIPLMPLYIVLYVIYYIILLFILLYCVIVLFCLFAILSVLMFCCSVGLCLD